MLVYPVRISAVIVKKTVMSMSRIGLNSAPMANSGIPSGTTHRQTMIIA